MNHSETENGVVTTGITIFYSEFYARLDLEDSSGRFDAILSKSIGRGAMNKLAAKGAILLRIIKYVVEISSDTPEVQKSLNKLGKSHLSRGIRPYQYAVFINVLIATISSRLGEKANNNTMEAWVNLFAFVFRTMLPPALGNTVNEREISINTASNFSTTEAQKAEEEDKAKAKVLRKYLKTHVIERSDL